MLFYIFNFPAAALKKDSKFLLYGNLKLGGIRGISLESENNHEVIAPITGFKRPVALDYDAVDGYIYFSDEQTGKIMRTRLNGSDTTDFITGKQNH